MDNSARDRKGSVATGGSLKREGVKYWIHHDRGGERH